MEARVTYKAKRMLYMATPLIIAPLCFALFFVLLVLRSEGVAFLVVGVVVATVGVWWNWFVAIPVTYTRCPRCNERFHHTVLGFLRTRCANCGLPESELHSLVR